MSGSVLLVASFVLERRWMRCALMQRINVLTVDLHWRTENVRVSSSQVLEILLDPKVHFRHSVIVVLSSASVLCSGGYDTQQPSIAPISNESMLSCFFFVCVDSNHHIDLIWSVLSTSFIVCRCIHFCFATRFVNPDVFHAVYGISHTLPFSISIQLISTQIQMKEALY